MPTPDEKEIMEFLLEEGDGELHEVRIANHMGWRVDYARTVLASVGRRGFLDVSAAGRVRITDLGMGAIGKKQREEQRQGPRLSADEKYAKWISAAANKQPEVGPDKVVARPSRPKHQPPPSGKGTTRRQDMRALIRKHKEETAKQREAWREQSARRREQMRGFVRHLRGIGEEQTPAAAAGPSPGREVPPEITTGPWRDLLSQQPVPRAPQTQHEQQPAAAADPSPRHEVPPETTGLWRDLLSQQCKPVPCAPQTQHERQTLGDKANQGAP